MLMRSLLVLLAVLALPSQRGAANSYAVRPLEKTPSADQVFAFASAPPVEPPLPPARQLTRDDLLLFLREGIRHGPEFSSKIDTGNMCTGVFFTRDGAAYYWTLRNRRTLSLSTTDSRYCSLSLSTSSVRPRRVPRRPDEFRPLQPPVATDLLHFANAGPPPTGFRIFRMKEDIVPFLQRGKVIHYTTFSQQFDIRKPALVTLPPKLADGFRRLFGESFAGGRVNPFEADLHIGGTLATKDAKVFFWEQWGDDVIQLSDSSGAECVLKIP